MCDSISIHMTLMRTICPPPSEKKLKAWN